MLVWILSLSTDEDHVYVDFVRDDTWGPGT
jgi:hypothetical protein